MLNKYLCLLVEQNSKDHRNKLRFHQKLDWTIFNQNIWKLWLVHRIWDQLTSKGSNLFYYFFLTFWELRWIGWFFFVDLCSLKVIRFAHFRVHMPVWMSVCSKYISYGTIISLNFAFSERFVMRMHHLVL